MKIRRLSLILFILLSVFSHPVSAHRGGTDGSGGHIDHSTGEYHYHHGYDAHQHYDMDGNGTIDCPYNFNDNTSHQSNRATDSESNILDEYNKSMNSIAKAERQDTVSFENGFNNKNEEDNITLKSVFRTEINIAGWNIPIVSLVLFGPLIIYYIFCVIGAIIKAILDIISDLFKK